MYVIERFGSITLPIYNTEWPLEPVQARLSVVDTMAGAYDNDGDGRRRYVFPHPLPYQGIIDEDVYNDNRGVLDALRAAVGIRTRLYRRAQDDSAVQWCLASLNTMPHTWPYKQRGYFVVSLQFQQLSHWHGASHDIGWQFDSGVIFDEGRTLDEAPPTVLTTNPQTIGITNDGDLATSDVVLEITAGSANITDIVIGGVGWHLLWHGTLLAGNTLTIDAGSWLVTNSGVNSYANLSLGIYHTIERWIEIQPGAGYYTIQLTGGGTGSTAALQFYDRWA